MSKLNKKIILTGAYGGVGKEIAKLLCDKGATILLTGKDEKKLIKLTNLLKKRKSAGKIFHMSFDLNEIEKINNLSRAALKLLKGDFDILINNAGVGYHSKVENIITNELQEVFNVNTLAPILLTSRLLPKIRQGGKIINMSSIFGSKVAKNTSAYTASKHALNGFLKVLRLETASRRISVIQIEPGAMNTNFNARTHDKEMKEFLATRKMERFSPKIIAGAVLNLIEFDSSACPEVLRVMPIEQEL